MIQDVPAGVKRRHHDCPGKLECEALEAAQACLPYLKAVIERQKKLQDALHSSEEGESGDLYIQIQSHVGLVGNDQVYGSLELGKFAAESLVDILSDRMKERGEHAQEDRDAEEAYRENQDRLLRQEQYYRDLQLAYDLKVQERAIEAQAEEYYEQIWEYYMSLQPAPVLLACVDFPCLTRGRP